MCRGRYYASDKTRPGYLLYQGQTAPVARVDLDSGLMKPGFVEADALFELALDVWHLPVHAIFSPLNNETKIFSNILEYLSVFQGTLGTQFYRCRLFRRVSRCIATPPFVKSQSCKRCVLQVPRSLDRTTSLSPKRTYSICRVGTR